MELKNKKLTERMTATHTSEHFRYELSHSREAGQTQSLSVSIYQLEEQKDDKDKEPYQWTNDLYIGRIEEYQGGKLSVELNTNEAVEEHIRVYQEIKAELNKEK